MGKNYCLIVLNNYSGILEILMGVGDSEIKYVSGHGIFIAVFSTNLSINEISEKIKDRVYILNEIDIKKFDADLKGNNQKYLFSQIFDGVDELDESTIMGEIKFTVSKKEFKSFNEVRDYKPTLDELLDKISTLGVDKLTDYEKELLNRYSLE